MGVREFYMIAQRNDMILLTFLFALCYGGGFKFLIFEGDEIRLSMEDLVFSCPIFTFQLVC